MAPLFLKETFTKRKFLAICVGFSGILIIARPEASGLSIGMLAAIFWRWGLQEVSLQPSFLQETIL
ncbi:MAG: hypothetical protein CM15mP117_14350 [Alphaproteobacteria bacterium]|nr:MAG: hypothetical protein CM15mP117_14350 [Alphaproteobacteria bacterium]